jgi:hypothetical protein
MTQSNEELAKQVAEMQAEVDRIRRILFDESEKKGDANGKTGDVPHPRWPRRPS